MSFRAFLEEKFNRYKVAASERDKAKTDRFSSLEKGDFGKAKGLMNREVRAGHLAAAVSSKFDTPKNASRKKHLETAKQLRKSEKE